MNIVSGILRCRKGDPDHLYTITSFEPVKEPGRVVFKLLNEIDSSRFSDSRVS
jgi:hypothetical protein